MKHTLHKLLSSLLILTLTLTMIGFGSVSAFADTTLKVYLDTQNGQDENDGLQETAPVKTLDQALKLAKKGGTIVVCNEIAIEKEVRTITDVNFVRCEEFLGTIFSVGCQEEGCKSVLTLKNVTVDGAGVTGPLTTAYGDKQSSMYLVAVHQGGTLNVEDGTRLIHNRDTAVTVESGGMMNLNGGEISGNGDAERTSFGGGIALYGGTVNLNGGSIRENIASAFGGGVYQNGGKLYLNGTVIAENTAFLGGGVTVDDSDSLEYPEFIMTGGSIEKNKYLEEEYAGSSALLLFTGFSESAEGQGTFVSLQGGIIAENETDSNSLFSDSCYVLNDEGSSSWTLQLTGTPDIRERIVICSGTEGIPEIQVSGTFRPVTPVSLCYETEDSIAPVKYCNGAVYASSQFEKNVRILPQDTAIYTGEAITLTAQVYPVIGSAEDYTYAWYRDGVLLEGETSAAIDAEEPGDYTVKVNRAGSFWAEAVTNVPSKETRIEAIKNCKLTAWSYKMKSPSGKDSIRIRWYDQNGEIPAFEGVEIFRSTRRNTGFGKKAFFTTKNDAYYNTAIKKGTRYYYKVRGYITIDGTRYYTGFSKMAIRKA